MELQTLVDTWAALRKTRSRKKKTARLAELLEGSELDEVRLAVSYLSATLPQGKIGVGYAALSKVLDAPPSVSESSMRLLDLDAAFDSIAAEKGPGSGARRDASLRDIMTRSSEPERRFIAGLILGELRQGASEGLMGDAIAQAAGVSAESVRRASMLCGDLSRVAEVAFQRGEAGLAELRVELFVPLRPMLATPADHIQGALETLGEALFETKLDGARVQAHKRGSEVRVYSRALNEVTSAVPEVVEAVCDLDAESLILDGEALAMRPDGRPHPFQTTMRRFGRRRDVDVQRESLPLSVYFFDLLYVDGRSLLDDPLRERRARMETFVPRQLRPAGTITGDLEAAEALWTSAIAEGHEGLMAKSTHSPYEAGSRGAQWLKLKPAHTLDLVVIAAEWGSGRRKGWLSNLHLAAYDPVNDEYAMLGKTFKGLTDEMLEWQTRELLARETRREAHVVHVEPGIVAEVAFNEVQESPRYPSGLALRFARVKRFRPDKAPRSADQLETVREIHERSRS